ncbi:YafY family transcriptional regulator [Rhodococcus triatomae]|uniref:Proteasome accessory factor C n=1 Tax=Rhodococcus triatomae TaxID=300028 RepID=A0A1G8P630_9NOCA|nr:YafY family protein [Rhodococcus triatomae]QNG18753.1 YafY family transcriptional regulator [Rhodococcus triatomae]QNG25336.1 YafY family transcriptional regulator [Rhodococcus triatomae]SDI87250.1 proteasome accessory factor C [Rhodococcus triatomae]
MSSNRLTSRLSRLLNLVPYFIANPGISAAEAAAELGVSTPQLMTDLNQLWVCGLPGYGPGDLIDLSFSEESVEVTFSAGIDRPLRLTSTEATALLVALRSLAELPGTVDPTAAHGAIAKIEAAAGAAASGRGDEAAAAAGTSDVSEDPVSATVRSALTRRRALRITYYTASRDTVSDRTVDPMRTVVLDNHSYLQAWCREAEGVRLFRFDRIDAAQELDEAAAPPVQDSEPDEYLELFGEDAGLPEATLRIAPDYVWVLDYYPMDIERVDPDRSVVARMRYAAPEWMARTVVGFGAGITVLGPESLARAVRGRAADALAAYGQLDE